MLFGRFEGQAQQEAVTTAGDVLLFAMPAATLATTLIIKDKEGTWQFLRGFLVTELVTYGFKLAVNKKRPDASNNNSFPSGHTSTTFHSASFIHKRYGLMKSLPAYALAGFTAMSRIDAKKHDAVDVLAGAAIGIGSTLLFTTEYQQEHMELTFGRMDGNYMLGFQYTF